MTTATSKHLVPFGLCIAMIGAVALTASDGSIAREAQRTDDSIGQSKEAAGPQNASRGTTLAIGDRLKISFQETMDIPSPTEKRGSVQAFYQRMDLSGEFVVDEAGMLSLPRLGSMNVQGRGVLQVQSDLLQRFVKSVGRAADVTVGIVDRAPVYVMGPVRSGGAVKHVPGMTVLHAVALSGGFEQAARATQMIERMQEVQRVRKVEDELKRLHARRARLEAERDKRDLLVQRVIATGGPDGVDLEMQALLEAEEKVLKVERLRTREQSREAEVAAHQIRTELQTLKRKLQLFEGQSKVRQDRLAEFQKMRSGGLSTSAPSMMLQTEIADIESRRQDVMMAITLAETRLAQSEMALGRLQVEQEVVLVKALVTTEGEIDVLERAFSAARAVALARDAEVRGAATDVRYEIIRTFGGAASTSVVATEMTPLMPGDILRIEVMARQGLLGDVPTGAVRSVVPAVTRPTDGSGRPMPEKRATLQTGAR